VIGRGKRQHAAAQLGQVRHQERAGVVAVRGLSGRTYLRISEGPYALGGQPPADLPVPLPNPSCTLALNRWKHRRWMAPGRNQNSRTGQAKFVLHGFKESNAQTLGAMREWHRG
jgi:hypothetical protein